MTATMDPVLLVVALGAALGGFVQGLSGFAFARVAVAVWSPLLPPAVVGPLAVFGSLFGQILGAGQIRRGFDARRALPMLAGGLLGVPVGVALLSQVNQTAFRLVIGLLLLAWSLSVLFGRGLPVVRGGGSLADAVAGLAGGVMGGLAGLTGPAPVLWTMLRGWDRLAARSAFQAFNLVIQAAAMAAYLAAGAVGREAGSLFFIVGVAMLGSTLLGTWLYGRVDEVRFRRVVLWLLALSGAALIETTVINAH